MNPNKIEVRLIDGVVSLGQIPRGVHHNNNAGIALMDSRMLLARRKNFTEDRAKMICTHLEGVMRHMSPVFLCIQPRKEGIQQARHHLKLVACGHDLFTEEDTLWLAVKMSRWEPMPLPYMGGRTHGLFQAGSMYRHIEISAANDHVAFKVELFERTPVGTNNAILIQLEDFSEGEVEDDEDKIMTLSYAAMAQVKGFNYVKF